ncbi:MAG: hypothetical protein AAB403_08120 [Planctomycetota bacterium]
MDTAGEQVVLVDSGFLRGPFVRACLKDLDYRGFDESFDQARETFCAGEAQTEYPLVGEILDAGHPHVLQMRLKGGSEPLILSIPWQRIQGVVKLTEARKSKMGFGA